MLVLTMSTGAVTVVVTSPASALTAGRQAGMSWGAHVECEHRTKGAAASHAPCSAACTSAPAAGSASNTDPAACAKHRNCHISAPIHPPTRKVCLQVVLPAHAAHKEELQLIIRGTLRCRQQCCPRLQGRRSQQGELSHHHSKAGVPRRNALPCAAAPTISKRAEHDTTAGKATAGH